LSPLDVSACRDSHEMLPRRTVSATPNGQVDRQPAVEASVRPDAS
jgi:hypothetical protein